MCYEINDFEPHSFPIFLFFRTEADNGCQGGGVAKDVGRKDKEG